MGWWSPGSGGGSSSVTSDFYPAAGFPSGSVLKALHNSAGAVAHNAGERRWVPLIVPREMTFDAVLFESSANAVGGFVRVGVYASDADTGYPTGLPLFDSGAIDMSVFAVKSAACDLTLSPGLYYTVAWVTGAVVTLYAIANTVSFPTYLFPDVAIRAGTSTKSCYLETGLTTDGALPTAPSLGFSNIQRYGTTVGLEVA